MLDSITSVLAKIIRGQRIKKGINTIRYGSEYGGFNLYEKILHGKKNITVFSFGVGTEISFDLEIQKKFDCKVYAFDPTPKSIEWISQQNLGSNFLFFPFGLSDKDGWEEFHLPTNSEHVSGSSLYCQHLENKPIRVEMKSLFSLMDELSIKHLDILKMDIEGSEFKVLEGILSNGIIIDQICVEIHHRFMFKESKSRLFNRYMNSSLSPYLRKLLKQMKKGGYILVHISDKDEEYTFVHESKLN